MEPTAGCLDIGSLTSTLPVIPQNKLTDLYYLSGGGFGTVFKGKHSDWRTTVAVKCLKLDSPVIERYSTPIRQLRVTRSRSRRHISAIYRWIALLQKNFVLFQDDAVKSACTYSTVTAAALDLIWVKCEAFLYISMKCVQSARAGFSFLWQEKGERVSVVILYFWKHANIPLCYKIKSTF